MCGGLTVAVPLYEYTGRSWDLSGKRVGIGGLGRMPIQFAVKMGAETYAVFRGVGKQPFCAELGAYVFSCTHSNAQSISIITLKRFKLICALNGFQIESQPQW